jgi:DNA polymerase III subunit epsilon
VTTWPQKSFIVIDTETTGLNFETDRVIEVCVAVFVRGQYIHGFDWIVNSGKESHPDAIATHGITNEQQFSEGRDPSEVFPWIHNMIGQMRAAKLPVMAFNAPFDFSMLRAEWNRIGISLQKEDLYVIDPLVVDRHYQVNVPVFTKPWMRLGHMAARYGVKPPTHRALEDAVTTGLVAVEQSFHYPALRHNSMSELMRKQHQWYLEWAGKFQAYAKKKDFQFNILPWPFGVDNAR